MGRILKTFSILGLLFGTLMSGPEIPSPCWLKSGVIYCPNPIVADGGITVDGNLIVTGTSLLEGAVTVDSTISQGTASTPLTLSGNQGATGSGVVLNTGTTTMTTGLTEQIENDGVQQFALSGYGHPLYAFAGHQPVTAGNVSFVTGSGAVLGGTTTATVSVPTAAVGFFGIMVFNVFSSTSAAVTAVTGSTGTWVLLTDSLVSGTDVITSVFYCTSVAASGVATGTLSHASTYTDVAVGAYSNVGSILTAGAQTATGTGTTIAVSLTQTTPNSLIVAAMGAQYQQTLTASVGTLRETTDSGGGGATGSAVALVDITSDTPSTLSPAVTGVNSMAWGAYAVELKPGPGIAGTGFGAMTNITYTGSDAAFGMQFESGPSTSGAFTGNTKVFTMYLANPYSGAGNTWGATATYVGTGITPVGGGTPGAVAFYCVVTGTQTFEVWTTANFTPAINTYYNFAFETFGLSATY
jgi:hypothetical protein